MEKIKKHITPATLLRGFIASILVGSILTLVNQGSNISVGQYPLLWQVALTYSVPFIVSVISGCLAASCAESNRSQDNV